jgi:hypothetical protein
LTFVAVLLASLLVAAALWFAFEFLVRWLTQD